MVPKTKSFNNARPRVLAGNRSSAVPLDNFTIIKKVLSTATGEIPFSPKETPSLTF